MVMLLLLAACTSTAKATTLGQRYLAIVGPPDAALATKANSAIPAARLTSVLDPVAAAYERADSTLLRVAWPANVVPDVTAQVSADGPLIADLRTAAIGVAAVKIAADFTKAKAAAQIVRADLGLPRATN
jgi:hypothetical protein